VRAMFWPHTHSGEHMFWKTRKNQSHLLALPAPNSRNKYAKTRWEEQSFPDYIVDVTRNSLLSFTTSLTKVSSQAHDYFSRLSAALAFERMMRNCMGWMMPGFNPPSPMGVAPMGFGMSNMWEFPSMFAGIPLAAPQPRQQQCPTWFGTAMLAPPKLQPKPAPTPEPLAVAAQLTAGALFALPAAFLAMAPSLLQAWSLAA
jgi:hypothetical protein